MSNNPDARCNPSIRSLIHPGNSTTTTTPNPHPTREQNIFDPITIIGLVMFAVALFYSVFTTSRNNRANKLFLSSGSSGDSTMLDDTTGSDDQELLGDDEKTHQHVYDDEKGAVSYNYSLFHFMFVLATLYAMMTLTKYVAVRFFESMDRLSVCFSVLVGIIQQKISVPTTTI